MKRTVSKKSHSWWWDGRISTQNSKWMAENLEEMDRCVKEMLKLIEDEGDSFDKKAEMYYKKQPELISHVEDFYRMYCALAERYDHVTGELSKNIPSTSQSLISAGGSDFESEPPSPSQSSPQQTIDQKLSRPKLNARAAGFDFFLGSGCSSDSRKGSDVSSSLDSGSNLDSEDVQEMNGDLGPVHLCPRIIELEGELSDMKEKLQQLENLRSGDLSSITGGMDNQGLLSRIIELETELIAANEELRAPQEMIELPQQALVKSVQLETELNLEREQKLKLENQVTALKATNAECKCEIEKLNAEHSATIGKFTSEMSHCEQNIQAYEMEIGKLQQRFSQVKASLEADIADREQSIVELKASVERFTEESLLLECKVAEQEHAVKKLNAMMANSSKSFSEEKMHLESEILNLSESHASLKVKLALLEEEKTQLEVEKMEVSASIAKRVEELNQNMDSLKQKLDILSSEKDELSAKVSTLTAEVKSRDDHIRVMEAHLQQLHVEHVKLTMEAENAQRLSREMSERVKIWGEEVEAQKAVISDGAEKKREAIRQLCFSLEHYRDGYNELHQMLLDHRCPRMVLTT